MPSPAALRDFIVEHFDRSELGELCADYFPDFYRDYKDIQIKLSDLARELVQHCQHRGIVDNLIAAAHTKRGDVYEARFGKPPRTDIKTKARDPQQVFISYAYEDGELARRMAEDLRAAGLRVWIAPESIQPGELWAKAIDRGLRESGIFVVTLSPDAAESGWVEQEILAAIAFKARREMQVYPVVARLCDLDAFHISLQAHQLVDIGDDYQGGLAKLFSQLGIRPVAPLPNDIADAMADKRAFVRKGAVEELAVLLKGSNSALGEAARIALRQLADDDSRSVSEAAQAALNAYATPASVTPKPPAALPNNLAITSPLHIDFVLVPAGPFLMGSVKAKDKQAYDDELLQHSVNLPDFYISKTPVTNAQFEAFVKATGYMTQAEKAGHSWAWKAKEKKWDKAQGYSWRTPLGVSSSISMRHEHPVIHVSWHDSIAFCVWLSQVSGHTIALPSEAEWEKAARGADGRIYPWGNQAPTGKLCNFNQNFGDTTPVGRRSPAGDSPHGCVDMAGNVWEWTRSLWGRDANKTEFAYPFTNRLAEREELTAGDDVRRVLRGGSWSSFSQSVRAACRIRYLPLNHYANFGFRVVCAPVLPSQ